MNDERARYAQMIQELTEFEEVVAEAEELNILSEDPDGDGDGEFDLS
jgi:homoserine dehydrogenase